MPGPMDPRLFKSGRSVEKRPRISRGRSRHLRRALAKMEKSPSGQTRPKYPMARAGARSTPCTAPVCHNMLAELGSRRGRRRATYKSAIWGSLQRQRHQPIFAICWRSQSLKFVPASWIPESRMHSAILGRATCVLLRSRTSKTGWTLPRRPSNPRSVRFYRRARRTVNP
jgi:hypothetical protein